jgi:hypothetical protein
MPPSVPAAVKPLLTYSFYNLALFCPDFDWPRTHKGQKAFGNGIRSDYACDNGVLGRPQISA